MAEKLAGSQQENLLTLLCWSDTAFNLIRNTVAPNLFSTGIYRDIITTVYAYVDQFNAPPKDHLPDLLDEQLEGKDGELYRTVINDVFRTKDGLNEEYVLSQLSKFVQKQTLKLGMIKASELIEDDSEAAAVELEKSLKSRLSLFSPGLTLTAALDHLERHDGVLRESLSLGIPELDKHRLGPARKEVWMLIGPKKAGKTWGLIHLAKRGLMMGHKVSIITMEVSEQIYGARMLQSLFSLTMYEGKRLEITRFKKDELGRMSTIEREPLQRLSLGKKEGRLYVRKKMKDFPTNNLRIKEFPSGQLTLHGLEAYLDSLERLEHFVPDLVLVDYPQLMKINPAYYRHEFGQVLVGLRGVAVDRNIMMGVVNQSNRAGAQGGTTKGTDVGEDWSQVATADVVMTYSQTIAEHDLGLARLFVDASRVSRQGFTVMLSQCYELGQFVMDSAPMISDYFGQVKSIAGKPPTDEGER